MGLFSAYYGIACLVNVTAIEVGNGLLTIKHRPLPLRAVSIETRALKRISLQAARRWVRGRGGRFGHSVDFHYLVAEASDGKERILLSGTEWTREQMTYLGHEIKERLGIKEREEERDEDEAEDEALSGT